MTRRSPFAEALRGVLDDSGLFSRQEWAEVLNVSRPAISQWVNDRTIPEPEHLRAIVEVATSADAVPPEVRERLEAAMRAPAVEVSPHGLRAGRSFADYATRPLFEAFQRMWSGLAPWAREAVLAEAVGLCGAAFRLQQDEPVEGGALKALLDALARLPAPRREQVLVQATALCARQDRWEAPPAAAGPRLVAVSGQEPPARETRQGTSRSHSVAVLNGVGLADALRAGPVHVAAVRDGAQTRSYDFYALRRGAADDPRRRIGLWRVPRRSEFRSIQAGELLLYVVRGSVRLRAAPAREWTELSAGGEGQVFWMRAAGDGSGLPPFQVEATSVQPPLVLAVFYAAGGVEVDTDASGQWFCPRGAAWTGAGDGAATVVGAIPEGEEALAAFVARNPIRESYGVHQRARREGQLADADPPWWQTGGSALNVRLVRFHHPAPGQTEDAVCLDSHAGEEVIIPLRGRFLCVFVDLEAGETEFRDDTCARFPDARRRHLGAESALEPSFADPLPDVMLLESRCAHGFFAVGDEDCYALHVRVLAPMREAPAGGRPPREVAPRIHAGLRAVNL